MLAMLIVEAYIHLADVIKMPKTETEEVIQAFTYQRTEPKLTHEFC